MMSIYEMIVESISRNPRGRRRPQDGRGKGKGQPRGRRVNKNKKPCNPKTGDGYSVVLISGSPGIVALTALAYTIYKYYTDAARKSCNNLRGNNRKICILTFRINAATAAIKKLEEGLPACEEKNNPEKCKYSIQKEIWHWKQRREKYQNQLAKLNQARAKLHK
jgi:hypothetical protein